MDKKRFQEINDLYHGIDFLCEDNDSEINMLAIAKFLTHYLMTVKNEKMRFAVTANMIAMIGVPVCSNLNPNGKLVYDDFKEKIINLLEETSKEIKKSEREALD